jgi:hypothetical protein
MQSWAWADFRELDGYQTFRYGLFDDWTLDKIEAKKDRD